MLNTKFDYNPFMLASLLKVTGKSLMNPFIKVKSFIFLFLFLFTMTIVQNNYSNRPIIRFAFSAGNPAPYVIDEQNGLEIEIVRAILDAAGYDLEAVLLPNIRMYSMKRHNLDGRGITRQKKNELFYSEHYIYYENYAFTTRDRNIQLDKVGDLFQYSVCSWQTAPINLGGDFFEYYTSSNKEHIKKKLFLINDAYRRNRMLWGKRVDIVVDDIFIFAYYTKLLEKELDRTLEYDIHNVWKSRSNYQAAFAKKEHRDLFNKGLNLIKANGRFQAIVKKYK